MSSCCFRKTGCYLFVALVVAGLAGTIFLFFSFRYDRCRSLHLYLFGWCQRGLVVVVVVVVVSGWYQRDLVSYFGDRCCDRCYFVLGDDLPTWKMLLVCFVVGDRRSLRDDLGVVLL